MNAINFKAGDTVKVFTRNLQDNKVHAVPFEGVVISVRGESSDKTFTVKKLAAGKVAVERIFPLNSPLIEKITPVKQGKVRRAKLYYLRKR